MTETYLLVRGEESSAAWQGRAGIVTGVRQVQDSAADRFEASDGHRRHVRG